MVVATGVITHESLTRADILPPLHNFRIRPLDSTEMEVGQNLRLTAEGYYGTSPVVVKAQWNLLGDQNLGYLMDCGESPDCTFVATNPGTAVIEAEAHDQFAHVTVDIRGPVTPVQNTFTDTLPPWAERPILDLRQRSIIHGYEDGRFGSADTLTRGQLITLIYRMLLHLELIAAPANCRQYYDDVPPDHFAYDAACVFYARGWSSGLRQFDTDAPDHYMFYESVVLNRAGIMTGYGSGLFGPEDTLNRAQAATLVHRALRKAEELQLRLF
ncbi:MAG: N-acetylmuramoyl-L-alanine amidase, family 4 [Candidatus Peregrinibacteria bacterium GW2011_GWA2_54_9]|nr:MAG: N-acetylmuramoyl-L-alanine amidase, family 4 [Candidatus Peregrinibacteria bacterium GW2011_GWA2_54_9]